jgi:ubiquinone/menaquinone biosynthesis C-methylase UbiE
MNYGPASRYYDLFGSKNDIPFYRRLATQHGRKSLELGVGTGRVAIELAKANVTVWGLDNSKYMLGIARKKLRTESVAVRRRIKLRLADMCEFELEEAFPFAYMASSTFEHCVTENDQIKCLTNVRKALEEAGIFAFDLSQPKRRAASSWYIDRRELGEEEEVVRTVFSRTNPHTGVVSVNLFFDVYVRGVLEDRFHEYSEAKTFSREEVEALLRRVGFTVQKMFGDFDNSPYSGKSPRAIFVCMKTPVPAP